MDNSSSVAGKTYQEKLSGIVAGQILPKCILCIEGWPVHKDDVAFVEEALVDILTDVVSRIKDEHTLIIGTTPDNPRSAANQWLLYLKEKSLKGNPTVKIDVRMA